MYENGLLCRLDDRGEPVIQLSPPLVADQHLLGQIVDIVGDALEHAWSQVEAGGLARLTA
jgi:adenosylmethionine-8-amino-7-oxononanoate aminotransferase